MNVKKIFSIKGEDCIISPEDLGLVNGKITMNGFFTDVAEIRGIYAPPMFSDDFRLNIRFNDMRIYARKYQWSPECLTRSGVSRKWHFTSELYLGADKRCAIMKIRVRNKASENRMLNVQYEVIGGLDRRDHWGFGKPTRAPFSTQEFKDGVFSLKSEAGDRIAVASSLDIDAKLPLCAGVLDAEGVKVRSGGEVVFYTMIALDNYNKAGKMIKQLAANPEKACRDSVAWWAKRVEKLFDVMPRFASDNPALEKVYNRSMLHLLLNEWNVPEFLLHPYYATGSVNGGCCCCYLWNYGEPYKLWSMLNPQAAKEHIKTYLKLDLTNCFAFFPDDGGANGPYYPINQEKTIFLTYAYVTQTGDTAFLHEELAGRPIIRHMIEQATMHDDFSRDAVLVNYGDGNHHLELRRELRYDGIVPDLNLRRCVNYRLVDELCRIAGVECEVDMIKRAEAIKALVHEQLFDRGSAWFKALDMEGKEYLRYTIQMFKVLGWSNWALTPESEAALVKHLLDEDEFLGGYGIHSLSKKDPAYDERDIDNGGPGACISFAPAVVDRLYRDGYIKEAGEIFGRLLWLGGMLPYWGDSHRADIPEYRRDTPLQNDIQGAALAQTIIFGMFGIDVRSDFSVAIAPVLPEYAGVMELRRVRLGGYCFDVKCSGKGFTVRCKEGVFHAGKGETVVLKPKFGAAK